MPYARPDSTVTIEYIGTLDNGRIFHRTEEGVPLTVTLGNDELFPALEGAIFGMRCGETKNIVLTAAEAYGPRLDENIICLPGSAFPAGKVLAVGQKLSIEFAQKAERVMVVTAVAADEVTLDGNHPLAGLELTFALKLVGVE